VLTFLLALGMVAVASRWLASAARALGVPAGVVSLVVALL
jgi:hypothetical protein